MPKRFGGLIVAAMVAACSVTPTVSPASSTPPPSASSTPSAAPATSSPAPASSPPATTEPSSSAVGWTRTYRRDDVRLSAAHATSTGFLAGGCVDGGNGICQQAVLLSSPDGVTWTETALQEAESAGIDSFAEVDGRFFAIGWRVDEAAFTIEPMVWTSLDGASWTLEPLPSSTNMAIQVVVGSPSGTIAIGINAPYASEGSGFITWAVGDDGSFGKPRVVSVPQAFGFVAGASWTGDRFLAWGDVWTTLDDEDGTPQASTVLLESHDGAAWKLLPQPPELVNSTIGTVRVRDGRLIALGYRGTVFPVQPGAWTSVDGEHWQLATVPDGNGTLWDLSVEGSHLIARGREDIGEVTYPLAWRSTDGRAWTRVEDNELLPALAGFWPPSAALLGTRRCVAGTFGLQGDVPPTLAEIHCR